jgi:nucleoid-associated protein YgaU
MPNDAKLGLVVGVALVVVIAVVFFRREPAAADPGAGRAAAVTPAGTESAPSPRNHLRPFPADPTASSRPGPPVRRHVVREGETLYSLARHYYQDDRKFVDIYRANQAVLTTPDPLPPGTVLVIPQE